MTNKEILQASMLDIIFENRNKDYGAYALRKGYDTRLLTALGAGMSIVLLFIITGLSFNSHPVIAVPVQPEKDKIIIRAIKMPAEKIKEAVQPKATLKQKPVAEIKYTSDIHIKKDNLVKEVMPPVEQLSGNTIAAKTVSGEPGDNRVKEQIPSSVSGTGTGPAAPIEADFMIDERDPEFPGGAEAMKKFLARYLSTPDELQAGEKKLVKIRFKVDKDGSVNTFEIVTSAGSEFDNEVVRVCKKMPRWTPAVQNGIHVPVSYVLPVTFIGVEE